MTLFGRERLRMAALTAVATSAIAASASAQWQLGSPDGDTLRIGYMAQMRGEWEQSRGSAPSQNLFLRHMRVLMSARFRRTMSIFLGTDTPNFGKALSDSTKNNGPMGIYDFWITYQPRVAAAIDMGLIGTPNSHNSIQSISGMLASDFGPYSFVSTPPTGARAGRDYGVQARGYVADEHIEYRVGAFQGYRGPAADHELRYVARVVVDAFHAERSVYYSGTSLGARRSLAVGVSADHQERYSSVGGDMYFDHPLRNGDGVTVQVDVVRYDGGATFSTFPRQRTDLVEAGYFSKRLKLLPFVQLARLDLDARALSDRSSVLAGVGYMIAGHRLNLRGVYGRTWQRGAASSGLVQLTLQSLEF